MCEIFFATEKLERKKKNQIKNLFILLDFFYFRRKIFGCFYYPTVLALPSSLGAFISSWVLADRSNYHYAHGLSTVVSDIFYFYFHDIVFLTVA